MTMKKALLMAVLLSVATPTAQRVSTDHEWCQDQEWSRESAGVCEVREYTMPASGGTLNVDASPNGGIAVEGGQRGDILVQAKVVARAGTESRAQEIAKSVQVTVAGNTIESSGPDRLADREGWHVSYRLYVPTQTSVDLRTVNGGIKISDVDGRIAFKTINGGVKLARLAGDVQGETNNGGVDIDLDGDVWRGEGLDVRTRNGGVKLAIPEQYSARLETGTVNGGLNVDFPITVQGIVGRRLSTTLGSGGPPIRVRTTNGGVTLRRS
jgi:hypothetical protein